jgi:hypothetical protein
MREEVDVYIDIDKLFILPFKKFEQKASILFTCCCCYF